MLNSLFIAYSKRLIIVYALPLFNCISNAEAQDTATKRQPLIKPVSIIIPAAISSYGFVALNSPTLQHLNQQIQGRVVPNDRSKKTSVDDYLQYGPIGLGLTLHLAGIPGRSKPLDAAAIYGGSQLLLSCIVLPLKKITTQLRPDGSGNNSFPSGHTSIAFASAEMLRMEYKDVSPWIGVAGYPMAISTGYLRIYNNRHRFSEVITGACIGIISTKVSYWAWGKIKKAGLRKR